nr:hypothetical protein [Tanacetum cinerariifolium]
MIAGMSWKYTSGPSGTSRKQRVIVCYNCKGEGHMSKQCTKPKRKRDETRMLRLMVEIDVGGMTADVVDQ